MVRVWVFGVQSLGEKGLGGGAGKVYVFGAWGLVDGTRG